MVFCGKPSKGCRNCRERRIKCDQIDPACSQCLRAGKTCPGYRDQLALLFRDENEKVLRKARSPKETAKVRKRSRAAKTPISNVTTPSTESLSDIETSAERNCQALVLRNSTLPRPFPQLQENRSEDEGIKFFFTHYVTVMSNFSDGKLDLVSSPMWPMVQQSQTFFNAVSSVGFAGLSNVTKNPIYTVSARRRYAASLGLITSALKDTSNADLFTTLVSVMLLAAFEIVNGASHGLASWGVHVDGAAALLKLISSGRSGRVPSVRMQVQFLFSICIKSLSNGEPPPPHLPEWCSRCQEEMSRVDAHATILLDIVYRFTNLYASIRNNILLDSSAIIQEALALDSELAIWETRLPNSWQYTTKPSTEHSDIVYKQQVHDYRDVWSARVYNHYRWSRILLNQLVLVHLAKLGLFPSKDETEQNNHLQVVSEMATDLCTSVSAQFFCYNPQRARRRRVPVMSGCFLLLFPLAVAGSGMGVPEDLHNWVIQLLGFIGRKMGISQALLMIDLTKKHRETWQKLGHVQPDYFWMQAVDPE